MDDDTNTHERTSKALSMSQVAILFLHLNLGPHIVFNSVWLPI